MCEWVPAETRRRCQISWNRGIGGHEPSATLHEEPGSSGSIISALNC